MRSAGVALVVLALCVAGAAAVSRKHLKRHAAATLAEANCDCSWANTYTCGSNDGSVCNAQCCAPFRTAPSTCDCAWANGNTCGNNDGSVCFKQCCGSKPPATGGGGGGAGGSNGGGSSGGGGSGSGSSGADPTLTLKGITTRYWDCCKPSCAWPANVGTRKPVRSCAKDGQTTANANANNVCGGGGAGGAAYACTDHQPFVKNGVAYGFVATQIGQCCDCFELQFTASNRKMVVQRTNTGGDLSSNQFDIQTPGGGVGQFNGCSSDQKNGRAQWGTTGHAWGATYGGVASKAGCGGLPARLRAGCEFRFDWVGDNPAVRFKKVACPAALTDISGCK